MRPLALNTKLLIGISVLVVASVTIIALLGSYHYDRALKKAAIAEGEYLSHSLALEAADNVLINDRVALQKLIHHHQTIRPSVAYIFIVRDGRILAHTFEGGFPVALIDANEPLSAAVGRYQPILAESGERYFDFAWPILEGQAGTLRLGLAQQVVYQRVVGLWIKMLIGALMVLVAALAAGAVIARRISSPLASLAETADQIDAGNLEADIVIKGEDEIGRLGQAFSRMMARIREYTRRLEDQTCELDHAYRQTKNSFEILQLIGTQTALKDVCAILFERFNKMMGCSHFMMVMFTSDRRHTMAFAEGTLSVHPPAHAATLLNLLRDSDDILFVPPRALPADIQTGSFTTAKRIAVFPFSYEMVRLGALMVACPGDCQCNANDLEIIDLILHEAGGILKRAVRHEEDQRLLTDQPRPGVEPFEGMVGKTSEIRTIFRLIQDIAPTDASVLIQGESGTGKELVAKAIHNLSPRRGKPLIVINCSAYPSALLESELFGHEKGAFTGAVQRKIGRFEQAAGGTVFLDEIGEIAPSAQVKLLRVLQTHQFERLGGTKTIGVDVRVISATNRDLLQAVKRGHFREDLYYRLKVIPIALPPLRQRRNDIPLLCRHFLKRFAAEQGRSIGDFSSDVMRMLMDYHWPGNVRELENTIEHAVVLAKSATIQTFDLPSSLAKAEIAEASAAGSISENEARLLHETLEACQWNKKKAAQRLGISRNTLYRKLKKYRISPPTLH
jgi:two-component system response regulator HydG